MVGEETAEPEQETVGEETAEPEQEIAGSRISEDQLKKEILSKSLSRLNKENQNVSINVVSKNKSPITNNGTRFTSAMSAGSGFVASTSQKAGELAGKHVRENTFFLFILFIAILDATNNLTRSAQLVQVNFFLLIALAVFFVLSYIAPDKLLYGVIGLGALALGMWWYGYISLSIPIIGANWFYFVVFLIIAVWGYLGVMKPEGEHIFTQDSIIKLLLALGLSGISYYIPIIRHLYLPALPIIDGIIIVTPAWIVYMLLFKTETNMVKMLGGLYILIWLAILLFKSGVASSIASGVGTLAQGSVGDVDAKSGLQAIVDDFKNEYEQTQREIRGEQIKAEINDETRDLFIGVEFQDPILPNKKTFNPATDDKLKISARIHTYGYNKDVPVSLSCYAAPKKGIPSTGFLDTSLFNIAEVTPVEFYRNVIIPEDVKCTYEPTSRDDYIIVIQAKAKDFSTGAYVENHFIDEEIFYNRLERYATDNKKPLDSPNAVRSALTAIYPELPNKVFSFSDNGPAILAIATTDFPLEGISEQATGSVNLKSAIENKLVKTSDTGRTEGRIDTINSVRIKIPSGFSPSEHCEGWIESSGWIILSQEKIEQINSRITKIETGEQEQFPDCELILSDRNEILLEPSAPNPATFYGEINYDYALQRKFEVKSTNKTAIPIEAKENATS